MATFDPTNKGTPPLYVPGTSHIIPAWQVTPQPVPAKTLSKSAGTADRQQTVAGVGTTYPIIYGQDRVGGKYAGAFIYSGSLHLLIVWCVGEVDSIASIEMDDEALPAEVHHDFYFGTAGQTVNTAVRNALRLLRVTYTDTLPYVCYSVFIIPSSAAPNGFPKFTAVIKGLKVAPMSGGAPVWSDNPVLCAADFVTNTRYGMGLQVDWATVETARLRCNDMVGTPAEKRRTLNLTMETVQTVGAWLDTLRAYCGCILNNEAGVIQFINDAPAASTFAFTADNIVANTLTLSKRGTLGIPTVVTVSYTNTDVKPWRSDTVSVYLGGVQGGTIPWRESQVPLPGINRYSQARREAIERLNTFNVSDLSVSFASFDPALAVQVGDVVTVTHPIGLTGKLFRVTQVRDLGAGRWSIAGVEYDAAIYSDAVVTQSTTPDTEQPISGTPPGVTGLTLVEDVYRTGDGLVSSRLFVTWAEPDYPHTLRYFVQVFEGSTAGQLVCQGEALAGFPSFTTPALREGITYEVGVTLISKTTASGPRVTATKPLVGKTEVPDDVANFTCIEAGGKVYARWDAVIDLDPTITYELRYGAVDVTWDNATYIQKLSALGYTIEGTPAGTWDFLIKAWDSYKHESAAATVAHSVVVTLDSSRSQLGTKTFTAPDLVNMTMYRQTYTLFSTDRWITDNDDGWGYGTLNTDNAVGTFNDASGDSQVTYPFARKTSAANSSWVSEAWDFVGVQAVTVAATISTTDIAGTGVVEIGYATTDSAGPGYSTYFWIPGKNATVVARFIRIRAKTGSNGVLLVSGPVKATAMGVVRSESGSTTTDVASGVPVILDGSYILAKQVQVTAQGAVALQPTYDRVIVYPERGLVLRFDLSASGDCGQKFSTEAYLFVTGDYFEYDIFLPVDTADVAATLGVYVRYAATTNFYSFTASPTPGQWAAVKEAVPIGDIGRTSAFFRFSLSSTVAGHHFALIRNVRVTDGAGVVRFQVYETDTEPTANENHLATNATAIEMGPSNSFLTYCFDETNAPVENVVSWAFEGI